MATDRLETILAQARQLSPEELARLIKQATELLAQGQTPGEQRRPSYVSLFGSGKGSYATQDEADLFIHAERDSWAE